jgi:cation diffusion facilitator CzcD-associated flavoprotein CzcO
MIEHFDVIVVGAGLSGIGAAYHLSTECPGKSFAILEAREAMGGTWDLFRYPGIRSDSDMYTLGYSFRPWKDRKAIADGPAILEYIRQTAREHGIEGKIRYKHRVKRAEWSSERAEWTVEAEREGEAVRFTCRFLLMCSGYYDYDKGYAPDFPGQERFRGRIVHAQAWKEGVDYRDKQVVVIGSGATAVTLVPELAKGAAHVVMLQRSPTYLVSWPSEDATARWLNERLPAKVAYGVTRWKNVLRNMFFYELARRRPEGVKKRLIELVREQLGPGFDTEKHFSPRYKPWDQRVCLAPDGDIFAAFRSGKASVATDHIDTFTEGGIRLASGEELPADLIVLATGLKLVFLGKTEIVVDGRAIAPSKLLSYKGVMFSDIPNLAATFGYTNASWTLKADLVSEYVCRLLCHMDKIGARQCTPRRREEDVGEIPLIGLQSGYVTRSLEHFPKQGAKKPWRAYQNYLMDIFSLRMGEVDDGTMEFKRG